MVELGQNFLSASLRDAPHEMKIETCLNILDEIDPSNDNHHHTLWHLLNQAGVFEKDAVQLGLYRMEGKVFPLDEFSDHKGPRIIPAKPVMTEEQARQTVQFLRERLPKLNALWVDPFDFSDEAPRPF